MNTPIKRLAIIILSILLVLLMVIYFTINSIVKSNIEVFGSEKLQASVQLGSADVSLFPIGLTINDLVIEKDDEIDPLKKFTANRIVVNIDHNSLLTDTIIIKYIAVNSPEITYNTGQLGLKDLGKKAAKEAAIGAAGSALLGPVGLGIGAVRMGAKAIKEKREQAAQEKTESAKPPADENAKQFVIKQLFITDAKFIPAGDVLWIGKGKQVTIPDLEVNNIDKNSGKNIVKHIQAVIKKAVLKELNVLKGLGATE